MTNEEKNAQWEKLEDYLMGEGLDRYVAILKEMEEFDFIKVYPAIIEHFRAKAQRATMKELQGTPEVEGLQVTVISTPKKDLPE